MKIFLVGATGRVGSEFIKLALAANHQITAFVRDPKKLSVNNPGLTFQTGDLKDIPSVRTAFFSGAWDAVVNVAGADPLKPSSLVTDTAKVLVPLAEEAKTPRYLAITGTAEMPKTLGGRISIAILMRSPVGHGARDHDGALLVVRASTLDWALIGCPWIKDEPSRGKFKTK